MRTIVLGSVALSLLTAGRALAQQPSYYVDDGRGLRPVYNQDPTTVQVEKWQVRLYKRGQPTGGNDYWGSISGKSAGRIMEELRAAQQGERNWCKFIGAPYPEEDTYTNPLGP